MRKLLQQSRAEVMRASPKVVTLSGGIGSDIRDVVKVVSNGRVWQLVGCVELGRVDIAEVTNLGNWKDGHAFDRSREVWKTWCLEKKRF